VAKDKGHQTHNLLSGIRIAERKNGSEEQGRSGKVRQFIIAVELDGELDYSTDTGEYSASRFIV
jgi:hypothetical protein